MSYKTTLIKASNVKLLAKSYGKRLSQDSLAMLEYRLRNMVINACELVPKHMKTVKEIEVAHAKS